MKTIASLFIILVINGSVTESVTVNIGFSITFHTNTVIQSDDVIEWSYGYSSELIAKLDRGSISLFNGSYGRFTDRLKLNNQTGDLTITDIRDGRVGAYYLQITGEKNTSQIFSVGGRVGFTDHVMPLTVMEGDSVRLDAGVPDAENYDVIRWRFENSPLAEINRKTEIISTHDERFRDRLELDRWSADLTITNITTDLSGLYEVNVDRINGKHTVHRSYTVTVSDEVKSVSVMEGHFPQSIEKRFTVTVPGRDRSSGVSLGGSCVCVLLVLVSSQIL